MTETKLTDEEVICVWMRSFPENWLRDWDDPFWTGALTLDALWEVESRLGEQIRPYIAELLRVTLPPDRGAYDWRLIHATTAQKVAALASVLRENANG